MRATSSVLLFASLVINIPAAAAGSPAAALPFGLTPRGGILVPTTINGSEPASFLLDTGSNASVISDDLAARLGLRAVARTTIVSATGQKEALVTRIEHLALGSIETSAVLATIVPAADLHPAEAAAIGRSVDGIIGQDILGPLRYTIDYRAHRIDWREPSADVPAHASRFDLERQDDRFLVRLRQDHRELRLVPDTGTEALVLFPQAETMAEAIRPDGAIGLTGLAGTRAARSGVVHKLRVGETTLTDVPAAIVRREAGVAEVDGLLPLHLFARVTFDGPERRLFIEAR